MVPEGASNAPDGYSRQYVYGEVDQLVEADGATYDPVVENSDSGSDPSCTVRRYSFDVNGNRIGPGAVASDTGCASEGTSTTKTWSYDVANRQTTGANGVGSYVYDPFGRQTTMPASDAPNSVAGNITIGYYDTDAVRSVAQNGAVTTYGLDPDGRRVTSTTSAATVTNHYTDGSDNPDWATQLGGSTTQTSIYTGDITGVLGATTIVSGSSAAVSLDLADMGGNTVATVPLPASGNATSVTGYASYDEYGNPETGAISTGADSYGWLGTKQRASDSTGLVLMGARLYDSTTGRFTSVDPKVGGNANAYNYPDDPLDETDLSGDMAAWALAAEGWIGSAEAVNVADDWNPVGWGTAAALGAAAVTILAVDAVQNAKGSGVMAAHKKKAPQSSANANPHRTTKNGKSGSDKHTKRDGHGGQRHLPPNPNKRAR